MRVDLFDFTVPEELIAQRPAEPRDAARLLHVGERLADRSVRDLPDLVDERDLLVVNDTKVIPARLLGRRGEAHVELLLHRPTSDGAWLCFAKPARKCREGDRIEISDDLQALVLENLGGGEVLVRLIHEGRLEDAIERHGIMPLPPYIRRSDKGDPKDRVDYQTLFAAKPGAVAAPTAGLHFTEALKGRLEKKGARFASITLHVGAGTFLPIKVDDIGQHRMHEEHFEISAETVDLVHRHKKSGGRILACGTTSLRALEAASDENGDLAAGKGSTDLFIQPGYRFRQTDRLLTNFHLPRSTLFVLVAAFAGLEPMRRAYVHAIDRRYRFYSFGDACLLERAEP
ncbi:MAG: tRNA preQ1(34) S-adenosylmethionine ribosyltransferase-isomerase QueA [Geminicoccaceae bacterium]